MTALDSPQDLRRSLEEILDYVNEPENVVRLDELSAAISAAFQEMGAGGWHDPARWDAVDTAARRYEGALQNWLHNDGEAMETEAGRSTVRPALEQNWATIDRMKQIAETVGLHARKTARALRGDYGV